MPQRDRYGARPPGRHAAGLHRLHQAAAAFRHYDYDTNFTDQWTHQAQRVPNLGIPSRTKGVVDLYDVSDDWIPIYDRSQIPGYYMAIGSSGNQFKNAPIAGKMMAALVDYCEAGNDHDRNPLQFKLPYIGRTIDVGFYSRKREINKESGFSVLH